MATLDTISTSILTKLEQEAGRSVWWTTTEVKSWFNDLYIDICRESGMNRSRNTSTVSVAEQVAYAVPTNTIAILGITYDSKPIRPTTIQELNAHDENWRTQTSNTPLWYYYEDGDRFVQISLYPKPSTAGDTIAMSVETYPSALSDIEEPIEPFKDGLIINDGVVSLALAKEGEGQSLERSNYYWSMFAAKLGGVVKKERLPDRVHRMGSIEDGRRAGLELGSNYEPYVFN